MARSGPGLWPRWPDKMAICSRGHSFCIDVLRIGQNRYEYNNRRDLTGKFVDQFKGFACKIDLHLLTDHSLDMQCLTVLSAPTGIQLTELAILIWFGGFLYTVFLISTPQLNERHVFLFVHLFKDRWKVGLFIAVIPPVASRFMTVYQFVDRIIRDPFRKCAFCGAERPLVR